jgi:hypothetical protein
VWISENPKFIILVILVRNTCKERERERERVGQGQRSPWLLIRSWEILGLSLLAVGLEYFFLRVTV